MSERNQRFAMLTWSDLIETLETVHHERTMQEAGMTFCEITDLVQAQLFRDQPLLAIRAARVIEIRCAESGTVLYLRTGIPVGSEVATVEAGAFLPAIRIIDDMDGQCRFVRQQRVKRGDNWRHNLRRRLRESLRELQARGATHSLVEIMTPESDDIETDLVPPRHAPHASAKSAPITESNPDQIAVDTLHWGEIQPAGISLPVWMSAITSLALVLILLLNSPRG